MGAKRPKSLVDIYFACLGVWVFVSLSVCLYPLKVKTTEPIGAKFCVGPHMPPGKVYGLSKFQKLSFNKI